MNTIIGIDNGLTGGIAIIHPDGRAEVHVTPTIPSAKGPPWFDEPGMVDLLAGFSGESTQVFLEQVHFLPKQSSTSGGKYGMGHGLWRGILAALRLPYEIVTPKKWQAMMLVGDNCKDTKLAAALVARRLFPSVNLRRNDHCRRDHDGMADALLIAAYGRRKMGAAVA
jgi:crossover junction endodeoxyribonuclease RuvC